MVGEHLCHIFVKHLIVQFVRRLLQQDLLVNGLEKLALVFPHLGVIDLLHQLSVFVDEPCFPEYIGSCVLYLWNKVKEVKKNV